MFFSGSFQGKFWVCPHSLVKKTVVSSILITRSDDYGLKYSKSSLSDTFCQYQICRRGWFYIASGVASFYFLPELILNQKMISIGNICVKKKIHFNLKKKKYSETT